MQIYYLANLENKYSTEQQIFKILLAQGYDVQIVEESLFTGKQHLEMSKGMDLLLFAKGRVKDGENGLEYLLRNFKGKKVFWLFDKMYDFRDERAKWMDRFIPLVDIYFMTDGSAIEHYNKFNTPYHILRQGAEVFYGKAKREFEQYDVAFFGSLYTEKRREMLIEVGKEFSLLTSDLSNPYQFRGQDLANVCETIPVIIADALPFNNYWSNRIYEMLGAGAFLLHPHINGIGGEFTNGIHYMAYKLGDFDDLKRKIRKYLPDYELRRKIAKNGQDLIKNYYSYDNRVKEMMRVIYSSYAL